MGFFSKLFSRVDNYDKMFEPSETPCSMVFTGCLPKCVDEKFFAKVGDLPEQEGQYLIFPREDTEWLMFMYLFTIYGDSTDFDENNFELGDVLYNSTALPAEDYALLNSKDHLRVNKTQGNNSMKITDNVIFPESSSLKFSIDGEQYNEESIKTIILTKDYVAYKLTNTYANEAVVEVHEICAYDERRFDYVRWDDGSETGDGQALCMMEIPLMLPEETDLGVGGYWRPGYDE
jgi:hypothetical protein